MRVTMESMMVITPNTETANDHFAPNPSSLPWSFLIESIKMTMKIAIRARMAKPFKKIS